jgi:hypothetical protein
MIKAFFGIFLCFYSAKKNEKTRFQYLPKQLGRFISVALSRRLPVADVISYPAL